MKTVLIHLHIPKCGGTTIRDLLVRNFGTKLGETNTILNRGQYDRFQVSRILDTHPGLRCLTGHKLSLDLPFEREDLQIHAFTWVRNPADRLVSHYFFHRRKTSLHPETKALSLKDYIERTLNGHSDWERDEGQVQFLSGGSLEAIETAVAEGRLSLFPLERLHDSIYTLSTRFPDMIRDWRLRSFNASRKDQEIPEGLENRVREHFELDWRLCALAGETEIKPVPPGRQHALSLKEWWKVELRVMAKRLRGLARRLENLAG